MFSRQKYRMGSDAQQCVCKVMSKWVVCVGECSAEQGLGMS